jgi:lysophospholipase L1-like esterase
MRTFGFASAAVGLLLFAGTGVAKPLPRGAHYVAMGSSFAAGAGIGTVKQDTPPRCGRSSENYATLLAARLQLALNDQTCNGARTPHLLNPWNELAAQLDAVRADTRLVTATIGGNDVNYAAFLLATGCGADNMVTMSGRKMPCPPHALPTEADYAQLEANMRQIVRQVKARAPRARFVFVQYVTLVPDRPCDAAPLSADQATEARGIGRRLAEITARAARLEGGEVLPADQLSRRHTACDANPWSVGAKEVPGRQGVLWHPSRLGHLEIAEALARLLRR